MPCAATEWQTTPKDAWSYGYGEYDSLNRRTKYFTPMTSPANNTWQPSPAASDPRLKGIYLGANGGEPGETFAVIRRWTAPRDGFIAIDSTLGHGSTDGDGVQSRILSSRLGQVTGATAFHSQTPIKVARLQVKLGDAIDFVTDCRENPRNDGFTWPVRIKMEPGPGAAAEAVTEWDAQKDFSNEAPARRLNVWEKFAQVLLETNELTFVN